MQLGAFSISLSVSDLEASLAFYRKLGFGIVGGDASDNWLILRNGKCTIGLFSGMFQGNMLTFNPGWNSEGETVDGFEDVRSIYNSITAEGIVPDSAVESASGPGSFTVKDPDGNVILFDQHV